MSIVKSADFLRKTSNRCKTLYKLSKSQVVMTNLNYQTKQKFEGCICPKGCHIGISEQHIKVPQLPRPFKTPQISVQFYGIQTQSWAKFLIFGKLSSVPDCLLVFRLKPIPCKEARQETVYPIAMPGTIRSQINRIHLIPPNIARLVSDLLGITRRAELLQIH